MVFEKLQVHLKKGGTSSDHTLVGVSFMSVVHAVERSPRKSLVSVEVLVIHYVPAYHPDVLQKVSVFHSSFMCMGPPGVFHFGRYL